MVIWFFFIQERKQAEAKGNVSKSAETKNISPLSKSAMNKIEAQEIPLFLLPGSIMQVRNIFHPYCADEQNAVSCMLPVICILCLCGLAGIACLQTIP